MPNRILKESICTSDTIDKLSWFEEVFFYRLIVCCDDYGRMDARPAILKARLFPLKNVTDKQVESALSTLQAIGMIHVYKCDGKPYLQLLTWEKHQRLRNSKKKYPAPEDADSCGELRRVAASCGLTRAGAESQSQSQSQYESESNTNDCAEQAPAPPPVATLPLNDDSEYPVTQEQVDEWKELYPAVDVMQQLRCMRGWLNANKTRRKTRAGILRFINGWLAKEQNRGRASPPLQPPESMYKGVSEVI